MSNLETVHLAHLPDNLAVHIALYKDLKNASFLREQLIGGNSEFEYAFIDASMVCRPIRLVYNIPDSQLDLVKIAHICSSLQGRE
jgi:hypothetical protein